jgi:hypothetical protein
MRGRALVPAVAALLALFGRAAEAQWRDPHLIAGQVAFSITASFLGKLLVHRESPGRAFRQALIEGAASGLVAHAGYSIVGRHPRLALVGKALAQKSNLMTRRSLNGEPVFDRRLYSEWQITHSFLFIEIDRSPRVEVDVLNSVVITSFLFSGGLRPDPLRSLATGSLFFRNDNAPPNVKGFFAPGVIWVEDSVYHDQLVVGHELVHSLQAERGSAIADWHYKGFRFNLLAFASGVPALLEGWPDHNDRPHEREADGYAGRK